MSVEIGRTNRGKRLSVKWRKKLSLALKGRPKAADHRRKISQALKGKKRTKLHRQHLSEALRGKPLALATRRKLSCALKGRVMSKLTRQRMSVAMKRSWRERHDLRRGFGGRPTIKNLRLFHDGRTVSEGALCVKRYSLGRNR